jgi:hypothetical protein
MTMGIYVSLVDKLNTPSPLISNYMSYSGRTSVVTAVYLPGNALSETVGIESHEFDSNDLSGYFPAYVGTIRSSNLRTPWLSVRKRYSLPAEWTRTYSRDFDGSTTGMIEVEGLDHIYYEAELPFAPLPGSTLPTARELLALGEPPAFVLGPVARRRHAPRFHRPGDRPRLPLRPQPRRGARCGGLPALQPRGGAAMTCDRDFLSAPCLNEGMTIG